MRNRTTATFLRLAIVVALLGGGVWATHDSWGPLLAKANIVAHLSAGGEALRQTAQGTTPGTALEAVPVIVEAVGEARDEILIEAIGTARALRSVTLFPDADGEVVAVSVSAGEAVAEGQVVMRLDDQNALLAVAVAETRVAEAESALDRAKQLRRANILAQANVRDAEIIVERSKLELRQAEEALADRTLKAPFAGIVGIAKVEVGDRVTTESEIVTLDDRSTLWVEFELAERYLSRLSLGMALTARTPTFPDRRVDGRVEKIDSRVDPLSRTVLIRAAFRNDEDVLRPGMSFFVSLQLPGPQLASVPELALQWEAGESYLWRIVGGLAERVEVTARRRFDNRVLIEGDIRPGELVVIEGVQRLRAGRPVTISAAEGS